MSKRELLLLNPTQTLISVNQCPPVVKNSKSKPQHANSGPKSARSTAYVLVTPVYNEEALIGRTIESVISQTILPEEWVVVSDRSSDRTDEIVQEASRKHLWIRLVRVEDNPGVAFERVVLNTERGIRELQTADYAFLGLLDADVEFQADYFEQLMKEFEAEPKLGLAGGVAIDIGRPKDELPRNRKDVPGAVQFYRRECFESLGGLVAVPEGGWDGITCAMARMNGYETRLVTRLIVDHLKPRNISQGGALRRKWQMGVRDYAVGYHPLFECIKCLGRHKEPPFLLGAISWWLGYFSSMLRRRSRRVPKTVVKQIRREQSQRMKAALKMGRLQP